MLGGSEYDIRVVAMVLLCLKQGITQIISHYRMTLPGIYISTKFQKYQTTSKIFYIKL